VIGPRDNGFPGPDVALEGPDVAQSSRTHF